MGGRMQHLASLARLVARGLTSRGEQAPEPQIPRRKPAVERSGIAVEPARLAAYLRATGGEGIAAFAGADAVAPPFFPATWEALQGLELFAGLEPPLPLGGIVHVESELIQVRPIVPGDRVRCRMELDRAERVRRGVRLTLAVRSWNGSGQLCTQSTAVFLARGRGPAGGEREPRPPEAERREPAHWEELARWELKGSAGRRYARVSGDYNPIHLWPWTARPFGFRRPILHGFCTAAHVAHALVRHRFGGSPQALRRLKVAFRSPLPLPSAAVLLVGDLPGERRFRVVAADDAERVYAEGSYAGAAPIRAVD